MDPHRHQPRPLQLTGLTLSRPRDGRIVEDRTAFDSLDLLHALGPRRTLQAAPTCSARSGTATTSPAEATA